MNIDIINDGILIANKKFCYYTTFNDLNATKTAITVFTKTLCLTAKHCIPENFSTGTIIEIFDEQDQLYRVKFIADNEQLDLALFFKVDSIPFPFIPRLGSPGPGVKVLMLVRFKLL